jgi:hypothetical protein
MTTLQEDIRDIEAKQIDLEDTANNAIADIIQGVERVTGRTFRPRITLNVVIYRDKEKDPNKQFLLDSPNKPLREWVKESAREIRDNWRFDTACDFNTWATPIFYDAWNEEE